jgi:hypothetical protein
MRNIFLLPTDKPSSGYILGKCIKELSDVKIGQLVRTHYMMFSNEYFQPQNIYITNDEEIKEGDWYLDLSVFTNNISIGKGIYQMKYSKWGEEGQGDCKKIILTDNEDLIKDGVQAIDDEFLGWFVKNPSCESKVERLDTFKKTNEVYVDEIAGGNYYEIIKQYKIIIPKEEPKQETLEEEILKMKLIEAAESVFFGKRRQKIANIEFLRGVAFAESLNDAKESLNNTKEETLEGVVLSNGYNKQGYGYRKIMENNTHWITLFTSGGFQMYAYYTNDEEMEKIYDTGVVEKITPKELEVLISVLVID